MCRRRMSGKMLWRQYTRRPYPTLCNQQHTVWPPTAIPCNCLAIAHCCTSPSRGLARQPLASCRSPPPIASCHRPATVGPPPTCQGHVITNPPYLFRPPWVSRRSRFAPPLTGVSQRPERGYDGAEPSVLPSSVIAIAIDWITWGKAFTCRSSNL